MRPACTARNRVVLSVPVAPAVAAYRTLLAELVREPTARFSEWRDRLLRDSQGRATHAAITAAEREAVFMDHVRGIEDAIVAGAKAALEPLLGPLLPPFLVTAGTAAKAAAAAAAGVQAPQSQQHQQQQQQQPQAGPSGTTPPEWPQVDARALAPPLRDLSALLDAAETRTALEDSPGWQKASKQQQ